MPVRNPQRTRIRFDNRLLLYQTNACPQSTTLRRPCSCPSILYQTNACPQSTTLVSFIPSVVTIIPNKCLSAIHNSNDDRALKISIIPNKCLSAIHNNRHRLPFGDRIIPNKCLSAIHNCAQFLCIVALLYQTNACPQSTTWRLAAFSSFLLYQTNACPQSTTINLQSFFLCVIIPNKCLSAIHNLPP